MPRLFECLIVDIAANSAQNSPQPSGTNRQSMRPAPIQSKLRRWFR